MTELIITAAIACIAGGAIAWLLRASLSDAVVAGLEAQLAAAREQCAQRGTEYSSLRDEHAGCPEALAAERERRAAAEAKAARVERLEAALNVTNDVSRHVRWS